MGLTSLKRIKEPPLTGEQYSIKERANEVRDLEKRRDTLAMQVKKLSEIFFRLEEGEKKVRENVEGMTTERLSVIAKLSKQISTELEEKSDELKKKSSESDKRETLLLDLSEYLTTYARINQDGRLSNEKTVLSLKKRSDGIKKSKKDALIFKSEAKAELKMANKVKSSIDGKYEEIAKICKWFEEEADREKYVLTAWSRTMSIIEKTAVTQIALSKEVLEENDKREGWLDDREKTLRRTIRRLGLGGVV